MDKDHRLDAPDNDALSTIEQLSDRSELTTVYPHAHKEWESAELISRDEREKKMSDEQLRISLSLRKWFIPIGILIPMPFVVMSILATISATYYNPKTLGYLMLPVLILAGAIIFGSYKCFKYGYKIFYTHGVKAWPFIFILLGLLGMSLNALFLITEPLHTGEKGIDMLIVSGAVFLTSIFYSLVLVFIWSSPRLSSGAKIACAGVLALIALGVTGLVYLF